MLRVGIHFARSDVWIGFHANLAKCGMLVASHSWRFIARFILTF
jgi:hypothetical protein